MFNFLDEFLIEDIVFNPVIGLAFEEEVPMLNPFIGLSLPITEPAPTMDGPLLIAVDIVGALLLEFEFICNGFELSMP
jgi:hypothetical protein